MKTRNSPIDDLSAAAFFSLALMVLGGFGWFVAGMIHGSMQPKHKVRIEYVIYRDGVPYHKTGVYAMKGKGFKTNCYTRRERYGHGANVLEIVDTDDWGLYVDKQSVCVYTGYSDVEVKSLKIIE